MTNKEEIRLQRAVMALCAILFAVFSFLFIAKYQSAPLELLYEKVSTGKLQYNGYVVGAFLSGALTVLALWLNRYTRFKREWTAMTFLPSTLLLSFITDIDRSLYTGEYDYLKWIVVFAVGLFLYAAFSFVLRRMLFAKIKNVAMSANRIIWRNLEIFVLFFCTVGFLSNGDDSFKREALIASYYNRGDIDKALQVGYLSNSATQTITTQRAYILAKEGLLGEKLFEYPQMFGTTSLLPGMTQVSPLVPDSVFDLIGVVPQPGEKTIAILERALEIDSTNETAKEYYLSALLLDRQIVEFVDAIEELYPDVNINELPKHYQEAILLYESIEQNHIGVDNPDMQKQFYAFKALENEYDDVLVRSNYLRRKFGRTYWWYYLYGNV